LTAFDLGGYCFEHGILLQSVLIHLGFQPVVRTARVILMRLRSEAALTHMFLTARVDNQRPRGRVSVANRAVTRRHDDREEKEVIESRAELCAILNEDFGFDLPEVERLHVPAVSEWT
jgi:arylamine N-acetyltransferase